ncbi:MAG: hypothetical protein NT154_12240 [Verrucomicrobia bacterium]|nr:hypothetical protein [Verrucomicrobiota bacterium]
MSTGPGGKMPPSTAGKDARRYLVAVPGSARNGAGAKESLHPRRWFATVFRISRNMKNLVSAFLVFAFAAVEIAGAAEAAKPTGDLKREAGTVGRSNLAETPLPQLSPNPGTVPEVPMAREPEPAVAPLVTPPAAAQPRKTLWMILAVLGVLLVRQLLKRFYSRSDPS